MDEYLEFVMRKAKENNKVFVLDSGEGRDYTDPETGWYIEDLSGWLVNEELELLLDTRSEETYDKFAEYYVFVTWSKNEKDGIEVDFKFVGRNWFL
ncbi:hypothetical protein J2T17_007824 [Paenibacillus mucilaginosus]|uniref:hypothetical protein n=1 Tax=Paenibacillus mucilaginosus TaxID=61624 RepID=UPI003D248964